MDLDEKAESTACINEVKEHNGEVLLTMNQTTNTEKTCAGCCDLEKQVSVLKEELESLRKKTEKTEKLLEKAVFERDSSAKYVESFREQVSQLHKKLAAERKKNESLTTPVEKQQEDEVSEGVSTSQESADAGMDIASSIREAAKDIATSIREAAQQATASHGFVFDEATGLYYDYNTSYYYDPKTRLYYDCRTGIYYTYNQERGSYEFYSQVAASSNATTNKDNEPGTSAGTGKKKTRKTRDPSEEKEIKEIDLVESGSEDGEIVEVEGVDEESESDDDGEVVEKKYPPCIRAIVMQSDNIPVGSLSLITCMGITFGRTESGNNNLRMSDIEVSKEHAKVYYDEKNSEYFVKDLGSQNGTFINGTRISESKQESEGRQLSHGEQLKIGSTTFLLHIHPGNETCDECEPGQVQAQLKEKEMEDEVQITRIVSSASDGNPESLRKKELKRLKKRYMLGNTEHEVNSEIASNNAGKYKDRAQTRRKIVGSEAPSGEIIESPASVFKPIKGENKGRLMLEKMGWVDGEGLGKTKTGRTQPVMATVRETGRGLGYGAVKPIDTRQKNLKSFTWKKTQDRYNAIGKRQPMTSSQTLVSKNWVKKTSKPETLDIFADDT